MQPNILSLVAVHHTDRTPGRQVSMIILSTPEYQFSSRTETTNIQNITKKNHHMPLLKLNPQIIPPEYKENRGGKK